MATGGSENLGHKHRGVAWKMFTIFSKVIVLGHVCLKISLDTCKIRQNPMDLDNSRSFPVDRAVFSLEIHGYPHFQTHREANNTSNCEAPRQIARSSDQWPFQLSHLEVPTIHQGREKGYADMHPKMALYGSVPLF